MSGDSTGQVLGATTTGAGIAMLPATGGNTLLSLAIQIAIVFGALILVSFTLSRIYRKFAK